MKNLIKPTYGKIRGTYVKRAQINGLPTKSWVKVVAIFKVLSPSRAVVEDAHFEPFFVDSIIKFDNDEILEEIGKRKNISKLKDIEIIN